MASHGVHHRYVDRIPMDLKRKAIFDAKLRTDDVLDPLVSVYRASRWQIDREALLMLAEAIHPGESLGGETLADTGPGGNLGVAREEPGR